MEKGVRRRHLHFGTRGWQVVVHLSYPRRQVLHVPGVFLDLWDGDALLWLVHQDLAEQVSAVLGHLEVGGEVVLHLQNPLHETNRFSQTACIRTSK